MTTLSAEAKALRDDYNRKYREEHKAEKRIANKKWKEAHREQINAAQRKARAKKKKETKALKAREYRAAYWERKAQELVSTLELFEPTPTPEPTPANTHTLEHTLDTTLDTTLEPTPTPMHQGNMRQFVDDRLIIDSTAHTSNAALTEAFNEWSGSAISTKKFGLDFKVEAERLGLTQTRTKKGMQWNGIRLRSGLGSENIR